MENASYSEIASKPMEERDIERLATVLREALTYDGSDRPALIARIPVICNDIRWIKQAVLALLGGVGALFVAVVGAILMKVI